MNWIKKIHGGEPTSNRSYKRAIFIGRYQPYHWGHIELIQQNGFEHFILVGKEFMNAAEDKMKTVVFEDSIKAAEYIKQKNPLNTYILIKGSRGIKMEKVLEALPD